MNIRFDEEKLSSIMRDFYNATGINITIIDENGHLILKEHKFFNDFCACVQETDSAICRKSDISLIEKCRESKKMESHICRAGLIDFAIPILYNDIIICFLIFGQMKRDNDFSTIEKQISTLNLDLAQMQHYYDKLPMYDKSKIQSIASIAIVLSKYIILGDMLKPHINETLDRALLFINENLEKPLSIQDICKKINTSKSVLYKHFNNHLGCTVNHYIASERVRKSIKLLLDTDLSIESIASAVGFSSTAYYSKMFKKFNGTTPLKYRNENKFL